jgi:DNA mismatch repair protein MutL
MQVGYLLYDTPSGLIILDYKAAEERIWYELIFKEGFADAVPRQAMIIPLSIELDPISSAFLLDHITVFQSYGFLIAEFGRHFYRIEAIPAWLDAKEAEQFLREIILAIREETWDVTKKKIMHEHFARMAAVRKVAYYLSPTMHDAQTVINQIFATNNPLITPRGKPIFIELNSSELKRRFTT